MTYYEWIENLTDKQKEIFEKHVVMYRTKAAARNNMRGIPRFGVRRMYLKRLTSSQI